jgi:immune inhibitor A
VRSWIVSVCLVAVMVCGGLGLPVNPAYAGQPPAVSPATAVDNDGLRRALAMEQVLRSTSVPERDLLDLAIRLKRAPEGSPRVALTTPLAAAIGSQQSFWVADQAEHGFFQSTATLRYATPHVYMWVENGYNVAEDDLKRSADRFETQTYLTTRGLFGSEWDPGVDADDHISIFNGHVPGVGGYYSSADEFTQAVNRFSNQKELFYINLDNARPGTDLYDGILAHEFQHMIHWNADRNEETWVNEGMAELSSEANGFNTASSVGAFLAHPDTQLTGWADDPNSAAVNYGAAHSFMHYLWKRFGDDLIRALVAEKDNGLAALDKVLRQQHRGVTANQTFADWTVANYLGDPRVAPGDRYGIRLSEASPVLAGAFDQYPVEKDGQIHQYGTHYYELKGSGDVQIDFQGASTVKLTNNDAHSGRYQWWSNRGDDSDMTLTHAFDLTNLSAASLHFWTWYDIESGWDYAYVAVSTDGGHTWDSLQGVHNTNTNVNGNSLGWSYTGISGGGAAPVWVQEQMDLTPYAGKKILLRFEYVTDDAVNHAGFCVDDIAIPELNFADDVETDAAGWDGKGFVRSENVVPEHFVVQLIEFGSQTRVRSLGVPQVEPAAPLNPPVQQAAAIPADVAQKLRAAQSKPYDVQANDSLWKLAQQFLGDGSASDLLVAATNARHEVDPSYARIDNARAIRVGARVAVPATDAARQELLSLRGQVRGFVSTAPSAAAPALGDSVGSALAEPNTESAPGALQRIVVHGLGAEITRAVLVISAIAPVTSELATYHLSLRPVEAAAPLAQ